MYTLEEFLQLLLGVAIVAAWFAVARAWGKRRG